MLDDGLSGEGENVRWDAMMVVHAYGRLYRASGMFGGRYSVSL